MDHHEMFEVLKYTIQCRNCGGAGKIPGKWDIDPCQVCLGSGVEAVSASDKIVEDATLAGLRSQVLWGGIDFIELATGEV